MNEDLLLGGEIVFFFGLISLVSGIVWFSPTNIYSVFTNWSLGLLGVVCILIGIFVMALGLKSK